MLRSRESPFHHKAVYMSTKKASRAIILPKKQAAAVHFITIPCEPNTAYKVQGKLSGHLFCITYSCAIEIVYAGCEGFRTFLYVVMSIY